MESVHSAGEEDSEAQEQAPSKGSHRPAKVPAILFPPVSKPATSMFRQPAGGAASTSGWTSKPTGQTPRSTPSADKATSTQAPTLKLTSGGTLGGGHEGGSKKSTASPVAKPAPPKRPREEEDEEKGEESPGPKKAKPNPPIVRSNPCTFQH